MHTLCVPSTFVCHSFVECPQRAETNVQAEIATLRAELEQKRAETRTMRIEIASLEQCDSAENLVKEQRAYDTLRQLLPFNVTSISPSLLAVDFGNLHYTATMEPLGEMSERRVTSASIDLAERVQWKLL